MTNNPKRYRWVKYKYIHYIDDLCRIQKNLWDYWCWRVIAKPVEAYWLLKREIRVRKARAVLMWSADAVRHKDVENQKEHDKVLWTVFTHYDLVPHDKDT